MTRGWKGVCGEVNARIQMHAHKYQPIIERGAGRDGTGSSARQHNTKLQCISESPPALPSLAFCRTCSLTLLQTTSVTLLLPLPRQPLQRSPWPRCVSTLFKDAGLYGDDHYVPAVRQTEAPPGSAAAAAAQRRPRTYYLSWCECIFYYSIHREK